MATGLSASGGTLGLRRGAVAVWIRGRGPSTPRLVTLHSVLAHTDSSVAVCLSLTGLPEAEVLAAGAQRVLLDADASDVIAATWPADLAVLAPGCLVAAGWLEALGEAARCDSIVASSSPLSTGDLSPAPARERFERVAAEVLDRALRVRPRIERPQAGCMYLRRPALELAGPLDDGFGARCVAGGLSHVLADDVLVYDPRGLGPLPDEEPLARSMRAARRVTGGLSVVIDARMPQPQATGTHRYITELVRALADVGKRSIRVVADPRSREALGDLGGGVSVLSESEAMVTPADVVHRPLQVFGRRETSTLVRMGSRIVVSNHDLIAYRNPEYLPDRESWRAFRRDTRLGLALADHVVFLSGHARADALADDLVAPERATVIASGVDHGPRSPAVRPPALRAIGEAEFLVCLGADYRHKNRAFALRVAQSLQRQHDWAGWLVFAGPGMEHGSSRAEEAAILAADARLAARVLDLGAVSGPHRDWLMEHAGLVVYPTVYEGFGLVPFEAAAANTPCLWAASASLAELLGAQTAPIVMWDARASADAAHLLLRDPDAAAANVGHIRAAGAGLTWEATATALLDLYAATADGPRSPAATVAALDDGASLSEDALRLVGPHGVLAADLQRPLLALAMHPAVGTPVLSAIRAGYRISHAAQRWRRSRAGAT